MFLGMALPVFKGIALLGPRHNCVGDVVLERALGERSERTFGPLIVVYFDQFLGAARTRKLVETLFFSRFQPFIFNLTFFSDFRREITEKGLKKVKRLKMAEKCFDQLSGAFSTRKLVKIHNT